MAVKQWNVGDILAAADMNAWTVPLVAVTNSDLSRTSSATLADDSVLTLPVVANALYDFRLHVRFTGPNTNGAAFNVTGPTGTSASLSSPVNGTGANAATDVGLNSGIVGNFGLATIGTGTVIDCDVFGLINTGSASGNVTFQWAQTTSSATSTTRKSNSFLMLRRIG